jgi:predicted lipid-binding transport protein (Tim44 family)
MKNSTLFKIGLVLAAFVVFFAFVLQIDSYARVGGGGSMGSRGSRSFSVPGSPTPYRPMAPSQPYSPYQSGGGSFFRSMLGGMAGGFLGGMLFRSLGFGGWGMGGGGIGFFEVILVVLILYGVYRFIKRRRETGEAYYQSTAYDQQPYQPVYGPAGQESDVEMGLRYIRQMDPYFDEVRFRDMCLDTFFKIQGAWANREMAPVRDLLTAEMYRAIGNDAEKLKAERKANKLDNIAVRSTDIVEAWQESGRDYITVRFYANLLDYTVDEKTGEVVAGSKTDPVKFEEYWTYTRLVGSNPWQLSAITQPQ